MKYVDDLSKYVGREDEIENLFKGDVYKIINMPHIKKTW